MSKVLSMWVDGACSGNPGPGGWGVVMKWGDIEREFSGYEEMTTNQRMELMGVIGGLEVLKRDVDVVVYSDSAYVVNCMNESWFIKWRGNGWRNSKGDMVSNRDLWERLLGLVEGKSVKFVHVKGHSGNPGNERANVLAQSAARKLCS